MSSTEGIPFVSVVVPCFNEADFIEDFIRRMSQQTYNNFEIIVADGLSDDGTSDLLDNLETQISNLSVVQNPARAVSFGLNAAIKSSSATIIVRMDVHTEYDVDYIAESVRLLVTHKFDCVGGSWNINIPDRTVPRGIAISFMSYFGSGGAKSRMSDYSGPVDTVYLGAWPRESFETFGDFDESLVRNQDDELCHRINLGGGRIYQSADIKSKYFGRTTFTKLANQFYQYGFWKPYVIFKHKAVASIRHLFPSTLVVFFVLLSLIGFYSPLFLEGAGFLFIGYIGIIFGSLQIQRRREKLLVRLVATLSVVIMHFSYGVGFLVGLYSRLINAELMPTEKSKISR